MIILEKPYVSDFLVETIKKNKFSVLDNEVARKYFANNELMPAEKATEFAQKELVYSNSENSIDWILNNLKGSRLVDMIALSKNKARFRSAIKQIFPDYFFKEVSYSEIKNISTNYLKFPLILKPAVGFLSFGVFPVKNEQEWAETISKLDSQIEKIKGIFPLNVVDTDKFIIEQMIEGDEFAVDAYFDGNGDATILNIYMHPFFNGKDVSDRAYFTSKSILSKHLPIFKKLLDKIGKVAGYKNFPFHLELRYDGKMAIPIELNPLRFCGWCITDITYFAWGVNIYEYFLKQQKPDWKKILAEKDDSIYYFTIGDIPNCIDKNKIINIDYDKYLENISNPLEIRKINYKNNPIFAIVFAKTDSFDEIKNLLALNMSDFITCI